MTEANLANRSTKFKDITGQIFDRLTVISYLGNRKWLCRCSCGKECEIQATHLRQGHTRSCGCLALDNRTRHAHSRPGKVTVEYRAWQNIKHRCLNPKWPQFELYGGRGITICERWKDSFEAFLEDVGPRPSAKHQIDRYPDHNGNYEPGNVRWAIHKEQQRNKRDNRLLVFQGQTRTVAEWVEILDLNDKVIRSRLHRGWADEDVLTKPTKPRERILTARGESHSISEWTRKLNLPPTLIKDRLRLNWSIENAIFKPKLKH